MHTLFNLDVHRNIGITTNANWNYIARTREQTLTSFLTYYQTNVVHVKSNHFIANILNNITISPSLDIYNYVEAVKNITDNLVMASGMTSAYNKGRVFSNVFYGAKGYEIILSDEQDFSITDAVENWKTLEPIKIVSHEFTNTALNLPMANEVKEGGLVVVSINIALLALQYRMFRHYMKSRVNSEDSSKGVYQFVAMYALSNMVKTHSDHALFNRFCALVLKEPVDAFKSTTPFYQTDLTPKIDAALLEIATKFKTTKALFQQILQSIKLVNTESSFELLKLPSTALTRQINGVLVMSRLKALKMLLTLNKQSASSMNQKDINRILLYAVYYRNEHLLTQGFPSGLVATIQDELAQIIALCQ